MYDAYAFGVKSVFNNFAFFMTTIGLGGISSLAFLAFLGVIDYTMFKEHFESLIKVFAHALHTPTGAVHVGDATYQSHIHGWLPYVLSKHLAPRDIVSIDITREDIMNAITFLIPAALGFKLFLEMISVGWTKMALDLQANKNVDAEYIYKFYYYVPAVFIVELLVFGVTLLGTVLLVLPGVYIFQRLRFARYFIIDKNQSIIKALESSWSLTDGSVIHLVGYTMLAGLLGCLSSIFFIGTFFLVPLSYQVDASVYRQMTK